MPRILYICFVLWFASVAVTFLILNIVPKLEKIFRDFGTGLPEATLWVIGVTRQLGHLGVLVALVPMAALGLLVYAVLRYAGVIRWDPPGIARLVRRLDAAAILDVLALAVAHEQPIDQAIDSLCWSYPRRAVRNRLASVLGDIREGTDWRESLHRRGLIGRAELAVLRAAQQAGNLPWAMRELADSGRRRFAYRVTALLQLLVPVMILGLGAMVFAVVVAFFLPLVHLIQTLAVP
jgi:type II secretory pathway component PulF